MSQQPQEGKPTPLAGCSIFITIALVVLFLAGFSYYQYREYKAAIVQISELEQTKTELLPSEGNEDKAAALDQRIGEFSALVKKGERAEISLSIEDLNLAISSYEKLEPFREQLYVTAINDESIDATIAFPVRAGFDGERFLNGTMKLDPVIAKGSLFPVITEIVPATGSAVPEKFIRNFPTFLFTEYRNDESIQNVFHKLSSIELKDGMMLIVSDPSIKQEDALPEDVSFEANRGLMLFGLLTFMFITTVAFLMWVRKRKVKEQEG